MAKKRTEIEVTPLVTPEHLESLKKLQHEQQHFNAANTIQELTTDRSTLEQWAERGVKCKSARFHSPCPTIDDAEPVGEFRLMWRNEKKEPYWFKKGALKIILPLDMKYFVDLLSYTPYGLIWRCGTEINITPLANVNYVRAIT